MSGDPLTCPHLEGYRSAAAYGAACSLSSLRRFLRRLSPGRAEVRRDPLDVVRCSACSVPAPRLYACLACTAVFCPTHAAAHAGAGHEIALDIDRAELFCLRCADQVYDRDFDATVLDLSPSHAGDARKRRRICDFLPSTSDPIGADPLIRTSTHADAIVSGAATVLRGLNNLGSTCFMNSVLQALLHMPPLRDYFLAGNHTCSQQLWRRRKGKGIDKFACLACDLGAIYAAVFSGVHTPYSPARFLYSWWQHASNLASYEQQDAHEFFISMLDGIHEKVADDTLNLHSEGNGDCCVAHQVFSGVLRSDVMCTVCGFTSTTYDPCVDISLDLDYIQPSVKVSTSRSHVNNGNSVGTSSNQNCGIPTLRRCLEHFTRPERLGSDQKFFCQHCQEEQESLKQMSIRKLPLATCFHIKRFEHSPVRKKSRKIDCYMQFPFSLDMTPYLSSSILRSRFGNRMFNFSNDDSDAPTELTSEFELSAVITHSGKLDAGHYITFLRINDQWYKCDDAWITQVTENIVRASQAYMLFYVQRMIYCKGKENPIT